MDVERIPSPSSPRQLYAPRGSLSYAKHSSVPACLHTNRTRTILPFGVMKLSTSAIRVFRADNQRYWWQRVHHREPRCDDVRRLNFLVPCHSWNRPRTQTNGRRSFEWLSRSTRTDGTAPTTKHRIKQQRTSHHVRPTLRSPLCNRQPFRRSAHPQHVTANAHRLGVEPLGSIGRHSQLRQYSKDQPSLATDIA